jgi:hypothetical protein
MMVLVSSYIIGIPRGACPERNRRARNDMMAERENVFNRESLQQQFSWRYSNRLQLLNTVTGMPFYDA